MAEGTGEELAPVPLPRALKLYGGAKGGLRLNKLFSYRQFF